VTSTNRGFTIVEVLVATVILAFGILAGVALLGAGFRWQGQAELATQLTVAAESKIEDLKAAAGTQAPDTIQLVVGGDLESNAAGHWDAVEEDGRTIERRWVVRAGPAGALQVTVVARPTIPSVTRRVQLTTQLVHR
jgi:prepilin-type N-terminal cleavage/methylation domain-containing protein